MKKHIVIIVLASMIAPAAALAAAQAPLNQEDIEAILEKNNVDKVNSSTLPQELKNKLNRLKINPLQIIPTPVSSTVATVTKELASATDKIGKNLKNAAEQARQDLKSEAADGVVGKLKNLWASFVSWLKNLFKISGAGGSKP